MIKGGGAAHLREKVVAMAADRFVVIGSSDKVVEALRPPVPLELVPYGVATLRAVGGSVLRPNTPRTADGGLIADYAGPVENPARLAERLSQIPGVVEHGLFPP